VAGVLETDSPASITSVRSLGFAPVTERILRSGRKRLKKASPSWSMETKNCRAGQKNLLASSKDRHNPLSCSTRLEENSRLGATRLRPEFAKSSMTWVRSGLKQAITRIGCGAWWTKDVMAINYKLPSSASMPAKMQDLPSQTAPSHADMARWPTGTDFESCWGGGCQPCRQRDIHVK
jgi:hypothetical protein